MLWTHMFALADDVFVHMDSCHRGSRRCNVALGLIMCGYCVWLKTKQLMSPLKLMRRRQIRYKGKLDRSSSGWSRGCYRLTSVHYHCEDKTDTIALDVV